MKEIIVVSGTGKAETELSAFDKSLYGCGIEDYNLIPLSSIIPPKTDIEIQESYRSPAELGNPLYCVYATHTATEEGEGCAAGVGWINSEEGGILVEHHGETERQVEEKIEASMNEMRQYRDRDFTEEGQHIESSSSNGKPTVVIVAAVFEEGGWDHLGRN